MALWNRPSIWNYAVSSFATTAKPLPAAPARAVYSFLTERTIVPERTPQMDAKSSAHSAKQIVTNCSVFFLMDELLEGHAAQNLPLQILLINGASSEISIPTALTISFL